MAWGKHFVRFGEIVAAAAQSNDATIYSAISRRYHQLSKRAEDDEAMGQAIDEVLNGGSTKLDDTEYNDIIAGDELWQSIQKNSGK